MVIDSCSKSWPVQLWLLFTCPRCDRQAHVALSKSRISIGELDGVPGPCFVALATVEVPGLRATSALGETVVSYNGCEWQVPAIDHDRTSRST
jgi:hypothetical protein